MDNKKFHTKRQSKETREFNSLKDVFIFERKGPWKTKSKGEISVSFAIRNETLKRYFTYNEIELSEIPEDIRGMRMYIVSGLKEGCIGAKEFHKIRNEIITVSQGRIDLRLEDIRGKIINIILEEGDSVLIPNHIMHEYRAISDDTKLIGLANTLFNPEDFKTHDSYGYEVFAKLKTDLL